MRRNLLVPMVVFGAWSSAVVSMLVLTEDKLRQSEVVVSSSPASRVDAAKRELKNDQRTLPQHANQQALAPGNAVAMPHARPMSLAGHADQLALASSNALPLPKPRPSVGPVLAVLSDEVVLSDERLDEITAGIDVGARRVNSSLNSNALTANVLKVILTKEPVVLRNPIR